MQPATQPAADAVAASRFSHYNPPVFVGREPAYNTFPVGDLQ